jgi:hypothetical protein
MKKMNKVLLSIAAAAALAFTVPAIAQQKAPEAGATAGKKVDIPKNVFYRGLGPSQYLAKTKLIGQNVLTKDGQKIGDIEDLILGKDDTIDGVVIGAGGFLNVGDKKIGVRYGALKFETKDGKQVISLPGATKEIIAALEPYADTKTVLQKAKDAAKKAADAAKVGAERATDAAKAGIEKAKEAIQSKDGAPVEQKK